MSTREEGILSDPKGQREAQQADARARRVNREDLFTLERSVSFRRWFGRWAQAHVMLNFRTTNGALLQEFSGRRSLMLEMLKEFEDEVPGFYERVLGVRRALENELRQKPQDEE